MAPSDFSLSHIQELLSSLEIVGEKIGARVLVSDVFTALKTLNYMRPSTKIPGFKIVPKRDLRRHFTRSQAAYYILLAHRGPANAPKERVFFVRYVDQFLTACQRQIDLLWSKHRVLITHVGVRLGKRLRPSQPDFLQKAYERALAVQHLREQLAPRFRRI